ncbi:hypothetical protein T07_13604 [Trichinella nelsoni]|uniref:Uncharacterized protein n=1 Tax=Trichinella nelsoni TaxID=6336 RepID=A0A0V0RXL8_9BILA|nr:hypothetical protein T07_13604 [Trichinella nelsoni]
MDQEYGPFFNLYLLLALNFIGNRTGRTNITECLLIFFSAHAACVLIFLSKALCHEFYLCRSFLNFQISNPEMRRRVLTKSIFTPSVGRVLIGKSTEDNQH